MNDMNPFDPHGGPPGGPPGGTPGGAPAGSPAVHAVAYDGRAGDLGRIVVSNGLLGLLTLGIYRF